MTDRHPHQEIALKFWADPTQEWRCGYESDVWSNWTSGLEETPEFAKHIKYELRPCASKRPKRMRYPGGTLTFPMPEKTEPEDGARVYYINVGGTVKGFSWARVNLRSEHLEAGLIHLTREAAEEHAAALAELKPVEVEE